MPLKRKDLLGLEDLKKEEIELILDTAKAFKEVSLRAIKKVPTLRGKTVANLFYEPSTRTRTSFEIAAKRLSADVVNFSPSTSSIVKGESLIDTVKNIEAMQVDALVIRHSVEGAADLVARNVRVSVINAGDGKHEHPTQGLLDLFTMREHKPKIAGLKVVIIGDILHSRVARSNIWGLSKMDAEVRLVAPSTLIPPEIEKLKVRVYHSLEKALLGADVVMCLRLQMERQQGNYFPNAREYIHLFSLTAERLRLAKKDCMVMHPGPINRGVEISQEVADGAQSVILEQVTNGIAVRMAALFLLLTKNVKI